MLTAFNVRIYQEELMTETPDETFNYDPEMDQDWDADEHGSMADHATEDEAVELEGEE